MPAIPDEVLGDAHRLRHDLLSALTIMCAQTQLLQRQLRRMDGLSDGDRARLVSGLAVTLTAARALSARITELLATRQDREGSVRGPVKHC